ncbi:uncharacterized protein L203_102394 [Cryptococcus depauperatus CBS 7841]|uniref:Uncharacterized protein n=1 Tax=Cryptococcus depauperatus CBS 7841 TaxID=1295531 RepID=A0A1E3IAH6_9TREE|nr:hypothetical protein L203_04852 [Cryptococcus depauperatus CBS 7841]
MSSIAPETSGNSNGRYLGCLRTNGQAGLAYKGAGTRTRRFGLPTCPKMNSWPPNDGASAFSEISQLVTEQKPLSIRPADSYHPVKRSHKTDSLVARVHNPDIRRSRGSCRFQPPTGSQISPSPRAPTFRTDDVLTQRGDVLSTIDTKLANGGKPADTDEPIGLKPKKSEFKYSNNPDNSQRRKRRWERMMCKHSNNSSNDSNKPSLPRDHTDGVSLEHASIRFFH